MKKQVFIGFIIVLVFIQFIKVDKNESTDLTYDILIVILFHMI